MSSISIGCENKNIDVEGNISFANLQTLSNVDNQPRVVVSYNTTNDVYQIPTGASGQVLKLTTDGSSLVPKWGNEGGGNATLEFYDYIEDETESTTTSNQFQQKVRLTTQSLDAGDYRIGWSYIWGIKANNSNFYARVQIDDTTTIHDHVQESNNKKNKQHTACGFKKVTLTSGVHTIDLDFCGEKNSVEKYISNARLEMWKV